MQSSGRYGILFNNMGKGWPGSFYPPICHGHITVILLCLSGQEMAQTGQRPLLNDSCCMNSILWEGQIADPTIAYITSVNVMYSSV